MEYAIIGILIIIIIVLSIKRRKDFLEEKHTERKLEKHIKQLNDDIVLLQDKLLQENEAIEKAGIKYQKVIEEYNLKASQKREELENYYISLTKTRQENFDLQFQEEALKHTLRIEELNKQYKNMMDNFQLSENQLEIEIQNKKQELDEVQKDYLMFIDSFKKLEQEQQEKLFWTIQVPEESREDIHYLLTTVAGQVKNKDIIPKLVWSEYIQKPVQDLMKRASIEDKAGIYKITNLQTHKCYIGKSTKVRQRLIDHIKGSLGISSISDQKIHHAMFEDGLWNWTFECICECEKEQLGEKEKYYVSLFKSQEYGYNVNSGG